MENRNTDRASERLAAFNTDSLQHFHFGDPDASADDLLIHCSQQIKGVPEFLSGSKNIVIGERGVGKSALFKLVAEGKFKIRPDLGDKPRKQLIVPINEELDYAAIANAIEGRYVQKGGKPFGKYRFLWELYILSNVVEAVVREDGEDEELRVLRQDIEAFFGIPVARKFKFSEFVGGLKLTAGVKYDQIGNVTPSVSVEQGKLAEIGLADVSDKHISSLKDRIRKCLKARKLVAIVLIDKIDDFVVGLEYEEQKKNIQALIDCTQAMRLPELKLKIFLRADIFNRLDFEKIGYDKIVSQTIRLQWTPEDISQLVARRLAFNFTEQKVPRPKWVFSDKWLDLDPSIKEGFKDAFRSNPDGMWQILKSLGTLFTLIVKMAIHDKRRDSRAERQTSLNQEFFLRVIAFVFPSKVAFVGRTTKKLEVSIQQFLENYFKLGGDGPNPRLVLLFLTFAFEEAARYYSSNPDKKLVRANGNDEFEMILKGHVVRGYLRLQDTSRQTVIQMNARWRRQLQRMFAAMRADADERALTSARIRELCEWDLSDEEFDIFMAFYRHFGLFMVESEAVAPDRRLYSLPSIVCKHSVRMASA